MEESDLVRRAAAGDAAAAEQIWVAHRRWIAAVLLAHKPRQTDLEDLLQEVALSVVQKINQLDDPSALKPWLRMIAVNTARATGRKQTRRRGLLRLVRPDVASESVSDLTTREGKERQARARKLGLLIDQLPENYRECVLLRCARGMSHKQISDVTGLPETTVETRIARGRRMLRELAQKPAKERAAMVEAVARSES
ncbi:MAG: RNA polymerase sigma factor RpoE [Phycisphaerales bacterium]